MALLFYIQYVEFFLGLGRIKILKTPSPVSNNSQSSPSYCQTYILSTRLKTYRPG